MPATGDAEADLRAALQALGRRWGIPCDPGQTEALLRFAALLMQWNGKINLTGAKSTAVLAAEHYPDAFALAKRLDRPARLVDIGSGGGLPALPLAVLRPGLMIRLCEPIAKKGAFLRTAIRELGLGDRVSLDTRRGEDLAAAAERFDIAISRATFEPAAWLALGRRLVCPGGRVFVLTVPGVELGGSTELYGKGRRALVEVLCST
jgi:16S rRNA (guanine527-N7)-methyltransferase